MVAKNFKEAGTKNTVPALFAGHLIAIGKVVKLSHELPHLEERVITDEEINGETTKVAASIDSAIEQLQDTINEAETSLPDDLSDQYIAILDAQIGMLKSKSTIGDITKEITENKKPAATAIDVALSRKADLFSKMDDPKIASKADDLAALRDRLKRNVLGIDHPSLDHLPEDRIIVADTLSPAEAIYLYKKRPLGLLLASGSPSGHVGDLCAGLHIPCAFLLPNSTIFDQIEENDSIILDGLTSKITLNPSNAECETAKHLRQQIEARTPLLEVYKNGADFHAHHHKLNATGTVGVSTEISELNALGIQDIGLYRSEAALINGQKPPSAAEQIQETYAPILRQWKTNRYYQTHPLTFRTYDLEGDKRPSQNISPEEKWAIMEEQIGAIMDASIQHDAPVKIMIPNIRTFEELRRARSLYDAAYEARQDQMDQRPAFGMMLEIPSMITTFNLNRSKNYVDFLSVGTNDLPARLLAAGRDNANDQQYLDPTNPSVLAEYAKIIEFCDKYKIPLSFCGGQATNEEYTALFMGLGAKSISVRHGSITEIRHSIAQTSFSDAAQLVHEVMDIPTRIEREARLNAFNLERDIGVSALLKQPTAQPIPSA